jgi:uncharacterized membrane protein YfcA
MQYWEIICLFFVIAAVYASVGFGGGSSYLAVLALYAMPFQEMRLIALLCNIIVVTGGTIIFIRKRQVNWRKIWPIIVVSVPAAYFGGRMKISQDTFFILLGCSLLVAALLLWVRTDSKTSYMADIKEGSPIRNGLLGGAIGFLSGMVGIGGGIFLSPLLNLMKWDDPKKIAATASLFILVNSIAGIVGQLGQLPANGHDVRIVWLCLAVLAGGQLGARLGAVRFNPLAIRRVTAVLVFFAGTEVLVKHLPFFK